VTSNLLILAASNVLFPTFNFLLSTFYGMDAIATDEHGFSRIIARCIGAISAFNLLQSTLYGTDAIATDEYGLARMQGRFL
jgi:hypothetical protein